MTNPPGAMPPLPEPVKCQPSEYCAAQHTKLYTTDQLQAYAAPLIARVAELQADAERYRWLRDSAMLGTKHDPAVLIDGPSDCCEFAFGLDLDAAVDAARLKGNQA